MKLESLSRSCGSTCSLLFILLGRLAAMALDCLGRNGPKGGRRYCRACGQKTMRIQHQEYLRQGKLSPQCPRCGGPTIQFLPILTGKLANRLLRKEDDLDEWTIRRLRRAVEIERKLEMQGRIPKNRPSPNTSSSLRLTDMRVRESRRTIRQKQRMNTQQPPSRSRGQSDQREDRINEIEGTLALSENSSANVQGMAAGADGPPMPAKEKP